MKRFTGFLCAFLMLASCAEPPPGPGSGGGSGEQLYEAFATVLDDGGGAELCLGGVADSYPPQCGGPSITNWDWEAARGEESASGVTWGDYYVVGTYDGDSFTLTQGPSRKVPDGRGSSEDDEFKTPCAEPAGGWVVDRSKAQMPRFWDVLQAAEKEPDSGGVWMDYVQGHTESPDNVIANVTFTGDLERHERELREIWGGGLCVSKVPHSTAYLEEVRRELEGGGLEEMGLEMLYSSLGGTTTNYVDIGVVVYTPEQQQELDARYGKGAVKLSAALRPLEPPAQH